jgi:aspartate aminotransferase
MSIIAKRLNSIKPSPTLAVNQKAAELKRQGSNIISLGAGEPDFDTPDNIKFAAIQGIKDGATKYTNIDGSPELKKAISEKFKRENDLDYALDEITVGAGGKQVIYNLFMATINHGDEVIIPAPYWVSYSDIVLLAGGVPVYIECPMSQGFKLLPAQLKYAITSKTKWLILNSPNNPSGAAYNKDELIALADILRQFTHVYIMSDDIYEHIVFDGFKFHTFAAVAPDLNNRIFTVNGVSKAYSMTGWRIGYGGGSKEIIKAMSMIQSHSTSNPSSVSQVAAVEALCGTQDFIAPNCKGFERKRDLALSIINASIGLECYKPEGAFYLFPSCSKLFGLSTPGGRILHSSTDVAEYFLEDAEAAVVPGIAFGMEGYFRISYATSMENLKNACLRIQASCAKLHD